MTHDLAYQIEPISTVRKFVGVKFEQSSVFGNGQFFHIYLNKDWIIDFEARSDFWQPDHPILKITAGAGVEFNLTIGKLQANFTKIEHLFRDRD